MTRTTAITGVTGFIGRNLLRAFAGAGWRVIGLCRQPEEMPASASVSFAHFDLREKFEGSLAGVDTLIHCAIEPYRDTGERLESINVVGSKRLFESAREQGVSRIIFMSSIAARRQTQSQYGLDKFAIESLLDPRRDIVIRAGLVVGDGGLFRAMYDSICKTQVAPIFSGGGQPVYIIGIDNLTAATLHLAEHGNAGTYVLAARDPITMKSLYQQIARKAGVRLRLLPLPYAPTLWMVRLFERLGASLPISSGSLKGLATREYLEIPSHEEMGMRIEPFASALDAVTFAAS